YEVQISSIVRNVFIHKNFSPLIKNPEDYVKNVDMFHLNPLFDEIFATWYARYCDTYENYMVGSPHHSNYHTTS
ncbi:unnamed protein product, partial [Hymenolepis diminuta]